MVFLLLLLLLLLLPETNRTPFDFAEWESKLLSGFNVEYGGGGFALISLAEHASILFMSLLFCIIFWSIDLYSFIFIFSLLLFLFYLYGFAVLCLVSVMIS